MAYDDGFYYGQCKIICEAETTAYNGKTVTVTSGSFSKSGVIANKLFECIVPGRGQYTISVLNGSTVLWSGTVEAGYGECIHQMLADGYEAIIEKSKLTLAEIEAAPGSVADYVPDADAVKTLNTNLTANNQSFRYGYDSVSDKYGYIREVDGADTFFPFKSGYENYTLLSSKYGHTASGHVINSYTVPRDMTIMVVTFGTGGYTNVNKPTITGTYTEKCSLAIGNGYFSENIWIAEVNSETVLDTDISMGGSSAYEGGIVYYELS